MKKLLRRLKNKKGETLIETLAAILVFTLSSVILLTMSTTAAEMNSTNQEAAERSQAQAALAEKGPDSGTTPQTGTVTFTVNGVAGEPETVYIYGGDVMYAFYKGAG